MGTPNTIKIVSRWDSSRVLFECEIPEGLDSGMAMRHALEKAVESRAYLSGADLSGADLSRAYLSDAYLSGADLSGADLSDAYLSDADLSGADLSGADLSGAYLSGADLSRADLSRAYLSRADLSRAYLSRAYLSGADLSDAYLSRAYLSRADLSRADLSRADLSDAYLSGADLSRAKWRDGVVINKRPIQIYGLQWTVTILDAHMEIGCQLHSLAEWESFDDRQIAEMDGRDALRFWRENKGALLGMARGAGREFKAAEGVAA